MIIEKVDPNREAFSDYRLAGSILTVAGIAVDLEAEQEDQEKVISITECGITGNVMRGMMACCKYLADIIIPPRKYDLVEVKDEPVTPPKGKPKNEETGTHTESVPVALDIDSVILRPWPVEEQEETQEEERGEEENA